jgi:menaquinone-dependent protoporphyrinogen IX oxidase
MKGRIVAPSVEHHRLKADLDDVLKKYAEKMSSEEVLAVAAQIVGMVIAYQNQRTMTKSIAMEIVAMNIETGNRLALDTLRKAPVGGTA